MEALAFIEGGGLFSTDKSGKIKDEFDGNTFIIEEKKDCSPQVQ